MDDQKLQQIIQQGIKEAHASGIQSGKQETSNLVYSLKDVFEQRFDETMSHLIEMKQDIKETKQKLEFQNGRVRKLEDWQNTTQIGITTLNTILQDYQVNKGRIWLAVGLITLFGATIITLSITAIDSKIEKGIQQALINNVKEINYEN
jgi:hypothetical protein